MPATTTAASRTALWPEPRPLHIGIVAADLLRRLDRADEARTEYERAFKFAHTEPERRFLQQRLAEVGG